MNSYTASFNPSLKEGKDVMSAALYHRISMWFIEWGTLDGVFAYCFWSSHGILHVALTILPKSKHWMYCW